MLAKSLGLSCLFLIVLIRMAIADPCVAASNNAAQYGGLTSQTLGFSTSGPNQLALAYFEHYGSSVAPSITSLTGGGTWSKRIRFLPGSAAGFMWADEVWYSVIATAGSYTANFSLDVAPNEGDLLLTVFSGSFAVNKFDPNISLPATASDYSGASGVAQVSGVSTTSGQSLLLAFCGQFFLSGNVCGFPFTGWTKIQSVTDAGQTLMISYKAVTSPQSGISVPVVLNPISYWAAIADALNGGSCGLPPAATGSATGVGVME